jgi:hypothetical protein
VSGRAGTLNEKGAALARLLRGVYWLGGGSGAGKSTVARRLAASYGLSLYSTDEAMAAHAERCRPDDCPELMKFKAMSMDERWVNRSPEVMLETFHWFRGEAFDLIVEDLLAFPADRKVIVEGHRLLPRLVRPLLAAPNQAAWLIPTPTFRLAAFESRGTLMDIAGKTSAPQQALENLLKRDHLFTRRLEREAIDEGLSVIEVASPMTIEELASRLAAQFRL